MMIWIVPSMVSRIVIRCVPTSPIQRVMKEEVAKYHHQIIEDCSTGDDDNIGSITSS